MALERNFRVIYLDECMITKRTLPKTVWSLPKTNVFLDQKEISIKNKAILVAVSREYGLDHIEVHE